MSDSENEFEQYGTAPIAPLSQEAKGSSKQRYVSRPAYAQSTQSAVSSNIGHSYFDQMQTSIAERESLDTRHSSKWNRLYAHVSLLDIIIRCMLLLYISIMATRQPAECVSAPPYRGGEGEGDAVHECYLLWACALLSLFSLAHCVYRACLMALCFALPRVDNEHQKWMDRVADSCCVPLVCCHNLAVRAYLSAIDEGKAFPTQASLVLSVAAKILYIAFCAVFAYVRVGDAGEHSVQGVDYAVAAAGVLFVASLAATLNRVRLKKKAMLRASLATMSVNSVSPSV